MGDQGYEEEERLQIQQKLSQDHQYELRVAMIYAECERRQERIENQQDIVSVSSIQKKEIREVLQENRALLLPYYQLLSFLHWCDKKIGQIFLRNRLWGNGIVCAIFREIWGKTVTFTKKMGDRILSKTARRETEKEIGKTDGNVWKSIVFIVILQGESEREKESQRRWECSNVLWLDGKSLGRIGFGDD